MEKVKVYFELCHPQAQIPRYAHPGDAGMDVFAVEDVQIAPGETVIVRTGWKVAIPEGYELQIRPRSGLSWKTLLRIANSPGTIDAGYREEVGIILHNLSLEKEYRIKQGERIAQLVLQVLPQVECLQVADVGEIGSDRGGGFGSTGD